MSESLAVLPSNLEQFAADNGMTGEEALAILTDPNEAKRIQEITKWRARVAFHGRGFERLMQIANSDNDKAALSAITLLCKLGELKAPRPATITFEELRKIAAASTSPLSGITQIREAEAINADEEEEDA